MIIRLDDKISTSIIYPDMESYEEDKKKYKKEYDYSSYTESSLEIGGEKKNVIVGIFYKVYQPATKVSLRGPILSIVGVILNLIESMYFGSLNGVWFNEVPMNIYEYGADVICNILLFVGFALYLWDLDNLANKNRIMQSQRKIEKI